MKKRSIPQQTFCLNYMLAISFCWDFEQVASAFARALRDRRTFDGASRAFLRATGRAKILTEPLSPDLVAFQNFVEGQIKETGEKVREYERKLRTRCHILSFFAAAHGFKTGPLRKLDAMIENDPDNYPGTHAYRHLCTRAEDLVRRLRVRLRSDHDRRTMTRNDIGPEANSLPSEYLLNRLPPLSKKAKKVAMFIDQHPGAQGKDINNATGVRLESIPRIVRRLEAYGYQSPGRGYFPPKSGRISDSGDGKKLTA